jgi:hypothetical protein
MNDTNGATRERADRFLAGSSWDKTWADMEQLLDGAMIRSSRITPIGPPVKVARVRSAAGG